MGVEAGNVTAVRQRPPSAPVFFFLVHDTVAFVPTAQVFHSVGMKEFAMNGSPLG